MAVTITIRNVPEGVHAELKAQAALRGLSLQKYLRRELVRIASEPKPAPASQTSTDEWLREVRERVETTGTHISRDDILDAIDEGRKSRYDRGTAGTGGRGG